VAATVGGLSIYAIGAGLLHSGIGAALVHRLKPAVRDLPGGHPAGLFVWGCP
jgi:hypothetical protein